jgi:DNA polymerase III epsilon subunit-like protein
VDLKSIKWLVVDLETTGMDPEKDRPIEVGATWVEDLKIVDEYASFCDPEGVVIPPDASAIHHIVAEDLTGAPKFKEVLRTIDTRRKYDVVVAHNARFDMSWIQPPATMPVLDTLRLAQKLWPAAPNHKNQTLRYMWGIALEPEHRRGMAHSAAFDTKVTAGILIKAIETLYERSKDPDNLTLEKIQTWLAAPQDLSGLPIRFGKHKVTGLTWAQVAAKDRGYLEWFLSPKCTMDKDPDQEYTAKRLLGRA